MRICQCGCGREATCRRSDWIQGHWFRRTLRDRFEEKVERTETCWIWRGAVTGNGYGKISRDGRVEQAYRVAWELYVGPIPPGLLIDHLCRNPLCVNPDHLEPVTAKVNSERAFARSACDRGHELNEANTYWFRGRRMCRACRAQHARDYRRRRREQEGRR